jgi:hypothetical protein
MTEIMNSPRRWPKLAGLAVLAIAIGVGVWRWREKQWQEDMVAPTMTLINYTGQGVDVSLHHSEFPNPGEGASDHMGPYSGGGSIVCCVPMPTHWRPGIKMIVKYHMVNWPKGKEETKVIELPEYPDGEPGGLYVLVHSETDVEVLSSIYAPHHERWPGRVKDYPYDPAKN